ncbi:MAG: ATP-binding cassette domain-containing protein [Planctomycetes bacterium]|nr:ATP-binding cassette domain-containing protein [Planctomycetota bacterium]
MDAVLLNSISKSFGDVHAVHNLTVTVPTGSIYGFLGPNGAGKTTTLRMIMNIIRPDSGDIELLGHRSIAKARARIGYMPEERGLYRKMTIAKVLSFVPPLTPMVMILRLSAGSNVWVGEILASIALLVVTVLVAMWAAAKIFRTGILMYGKRPGLREVFRWLKYG